MYHIFCSLLCFVVTSLVGASLASFAVEVDEVCVCARHMYGACRTGAMCPAVANENSMPDEQSVLTELERYVLACYPILCSTQSIHIQPSRSNYVLVGEPGAMCWPVANDTINPTKGIWIIESPSFEHIVRFSRIRCV